MLMQVLLWVLIATLILIFPLVVLIYSRKLIFKKNEIKRILSGNMGTLYLDAYYPQTPEEKKTGGRNSELAAIELDKIIDESFKNEYTPIKYLVPLVGLIIVISIALFIFVQSQFPLLDLTQKEMTFIKTIPIVIFLGFWGLIFLHLGKCIRNIIQWI
jgi:hypothetical protein